jgi:membrane-bound ClpP family serine protease
VLGPDNRKGSGMVDLWNTIVTSFGAFDGITYATMAIIMVGAAFMMPSTAQIVTATFGALVLFAFSVFLRAVLAAKDAPSVARADWEYLLALPLRTLLVYAVVFGIVISAVHALRMLSKR